jgi:hypothetical protein
VFADKALYSSQREAPPPLAGSKQSKALYSSQREKTHNLSVSPEVSSYKYKEPGVMKMTGTMAGVSAEYLNSGGIGHIESAPIQLRARFNYMYSDNIKYDGALMSGTPYKFSGDTNYFYDMAFAGGFKSRITDNVYLAPYVGFGYRYFVDRDDGSEPADYRREQAYYYLPLGADLKVLLPANWRLNFNAEVDFLLYGRNKTYLFGEMTFRQKNGYGWRAAIRLEKDFKYAGFFVEPFYRSWYIGDSNIKEYGGFYFVEPENRTHEFGAKIGASF